MQGGGLHSGSPPGHGEKGAAPATQSHSGSSPFCGGSLENRLVWGWGVVFPLSSSPVREIPWCALESPSQGDCAGPRQAAPPAPTVSRRKHKEPPSCCPPGPLEAPATVTERRWAMIPSGGQSGQGSGQATVGTQHQKAQTTITAFTPTPQLLLWRCWCPPPALSMSAVCSRPKGLRSINYHQRSLSANPKMPQFAPERCWNAPPQPG